MVVSRVEPRPIQPFHRGPLLSAARDYRPLAFRLFWFRAFRIHHLERWNDQEAPIEMHLEATQEVHFAIEGHFAMGKGETIYTENSLKYGPRDAGVPLRAGGWTPIADWGVQPSTLLNHSCGRGSPRRRIKLSAGAKLWREQWDCPGNKVRFQPEPSAGSSCPNRWPKGGYTLSGCVGACECASGD